jgi:argininosuccinate synthase
VERIVLAYSGGLKDSVAIGWLAEHRRAEVVTVTLDLGQARGVDDVRERALAIGAARAHVVDARDEFARDFILPALQAGAIYEGRYPLSTALGRPLIAKHLVAIARIEGATAIAHGGTDEGNDRVRIELAARAFAPDIAIVAPALEWQLTRADQIAYGRRHGIPVSATAEGPYSTDENLWGRSVQLGGVEDTWHEPPEDIYALTRSANEAPDLAAYVDVEFNRGVPVEVSGVAMSLVELMASVETIAGAHGVGRIDTVENRVAGAKSREIYEAPTALALHAAHSELQKLVTPRDLERLASDMAVRYADLVYNGQWYTPTREAIDAFVGKVQERLTGTIRLKLFKGDCRVVGRRSPFALSDRDPASADASLPPSGEGFITT